MSHLIRIGIVLTALVVTAVVTLSRLLGHRPSGSAPERGPDERTAKTAPSTLKRWVLPIAAFLCMAAVGGFFVVVTGIMPIKASTGHWPITSWFLNFAMGRSITTHAMGIETPALNDQALILKGAGHYEIGCRPCHGSPDLSRQPRIAQWMTPHPPNLSRQVRNWDANELFYIVKHGVKFTGMPAWPAQTRDDEVWAVVAFLLKLPAITGADYRRIVRGGTTAEDGDPPMQDLTAAEPPPPPVAESCGRCHGVDGRGREVAAFPKLTGQKREYFVASMEAYAHGQRSSGIMEPIAVALSQETIATLADYYAKQTGGLSAATAPTRAAESGRPDGDAVPGAQRTAQIERGRTIATRGIPKQRVPACADCHGPSDFPRNPNYPALAGQYADYLVLQLTLFKKGARGGTDYAHLMRPAAAGLTPQQMRDVASYYESLGSPAE